MTDLICEVCGARWEPGHKCSPDARIAKLERELAAKPLDDLADDRLRIAELERQLAAKPLGAHVVQRAFGVSLADDVVSVIAKWTAKYVELRERLCEAEAELARLSAREGDAESALDDVRPGWTEEELEVLAHTGVADAIRAMGPELEALKEEVKVEAELAAAGRALGAEMEAHAASRTELAALRAENEALKTGDASLEAQKPLEEHFPAPWQENDCLRAEIAAVRQHLNDAIIEQTRLIDELRGKANNALQGYIDSEREKTEIAVRAAYWKNVADMANIERYGRPCGPDPDIERVMQIRDAALVKPLVEALREARACYPNDYHVRITEILDAALTPHKPPCPTCKGTEQIRSEHPLAPLSTMMRPCPNCAGGKRGD